MLRSGREEDRTDSNCSQQGNGSQEIGDNKIRTLSTKHKQKGDYSTGEDREHFHENNVSDRSGKRTIVYHPELFLGPYLECERQVRNVITETPISRNRSSGNYDGRLYRKLIPDFRNRVVERLGKEQDNITAVVEMVQKMSNKIDDLQSENAGLKELFVGLEASRENCTTILTDLEKLIDEHSVLFAVVFTKDIFL